MAKKQGPKTDERPEPSKERYKVAFALLGQPEEERETMAHTIVAENAVDVYTRPRPDETRDIEGQAKTAAVFALVIGLADPDWLRRSAAA